MASSLVSHPRAPSDGAAGVATSLQAILALAPPQLPLDSESEGAMDLFTAASLGLDVTKRCLEGIDVSNNLNEPNFHGWTALMYSAYLGHGDICQLLLGRNANTEVHNEKLQTPLMLASSCGSSDAVNALVGNGARINARDIYGRSSLHYAVKYNQLKIAEILLENGADPNVPDLHMMTPMLAACEVGNEQIIKNLLDYKGDPYVKNRYGEDGLVLGEEHPKAIALLNNRAEQSRSEKQNQQAKEITQILEKLELGKYTQNFVNNGVTTTEAFLSMSETDLNRIGITLMGPKKKILHCIEATLLGKGTISSDSKQKITLQQSSERSVDKGVDGGNKKLIYVETELEQMRAVCSAQREELGKQRELNDHVRKVLSDLLAGRCAQCNLNATSSNTPPDKCIELTIRRIDQMNIKLESLTSTKLT